MHLFKKPAVDAGKAIRIAATINRQPTMMVVRPTSLGRPSPKSRPMLKEKKDKATYGISNPVGKIMGAIYKEHNKLQAVEVVYRTAADSLNDMASGAIDYGMYDNIFAASQERAGRVRILAVSTPTRLQANPNIPTMTELGTPMSLTGGFSAMVPAATPEPILQQTQQDVQSGDVDRRRQEILQQYRQRSVDVTTVDEMKDFIPKEITAWGEYVKLAKIEPQG